ncbi:MAG: hypothetical protein FWG10_10285 [Eubacteriaceae bacterium]|nr:hypothetical protein [Eubacteriaceae bacterium]
MTEELKKLYDERVDRFQTTVSLNEPDRVPILSQVSHWAIGYAGYKLMDVLENYEREAECYVKANDGFFYDGVRAAGAGHMLKMSVEINSPEHYVSPNGVTPQHYDCSSMTVAEYEEFYEDPFKLMAKLSQRKLSIFAETDDEESYKVVAKILDKPREHAQSYARQAVEEQLGLPVVQGSMGGGVVMDTFFDYFRGFRNTLADIRRYPEKIQKAIEVLTPYAERTLPAPGTVLPPFPWAQKQHHIPVFLNAEAFGKIYWPYWRKAVELYFDCGTRYLSNFEGAWQQHFDYLQDLPDTSLIGLVEPREYEEYTRRFGNKFTIIAGVPSSTMRFSTVDECIEEAKKVIDLCAPGGGLIFGNDRSFIAPGDKDPDKTRALNEWVHNNAKY